MAAVEEAVAEAETAEDPLILGEAYVIQGHIDLAKEQLAIIETLCGTECEEYEDLADAIADPSSL